jgi:Fe-S-cluster containining protein
MLPSRDGQLVQIIDAAVADAARRSGSHLLCRPGCTQCCIGVFPISQLDAARLRSGLAALETHDPARAAALRTRVAQSVARLSPGFPGDPVTGILDPARGDEFDDFANDEPCPVLDPATGLCDLYAARPLTCRTFGPPLPTEEGLGVCELCYHGASEEEIVACALRLADDPGYQVLEATLSAEAEASSGAAGETVIACALVR